MEAEEPIYEILEPKDVLIICKKGDCLIYAVNDNGKLVIKKAKLEE